MATDLYVEVKSPKADGDKSRSSNVRLDASAHGSMTEGDAATAPKEVKLVSLSELFSFADGIDKLLMFGGIVGACGAGISQPIQIVLLGSVLNDLNPTDTSISISDTINSAALNYVFVGIAVMVAGLMQVACWSATASRQAKCIRNAYVKSILTKEIGWFDVNEPMQLSSRVAETTVKIQEGIGRKLGDGIHYFALAVSGLVIGFVKGWELTLVLLAMLPFLALSAYLFMVVMSKATQSSIDAYGQAGAVAQEALSNARTVHTFNATSHFVHKYDMALVVAMKAGIRKGLALGAGTGFSFFMILCAFAVGMFYGAHKISGDHLEGATCTGSGCYDGGRVLTVFFSVLVGSMAVGQAAPSAEAVVGARAAAYTVFETIRQASLINPLSEDGKTLGAVSGVIEINDVSFAYPSRPDVQVCHNYSLNIAAGETVALVGPSGSGKSTIVSLLERFYDPLSGSVCLDGEDIRGLNVSWLRQQIGLVGQEPVLFPTSIMENIRRGAPSATDEQVVEAAKMANAYNFIKTFPQGFDTEVGERGTQLSGGQKQRIAIARAIVKNPPILLLDEATSALDAESERIVQESLDKLLAGSKRTTILIAHRLSTVRNADRIAVHSGGAIVEIGSHDELMKLPNGQYRMLVEAQNRPQSKESDDTSDSAHGTMQTASSRLSSRSRLDSRASSTKMSEKDVEDVDTDTESEDASSGDPKAMSRIWKLSSPEWAFLALGCVGAMVSAAIFPVWGVITTKITVLLFDYDKTKHEMIRDARGWALGFVGLGILFGLSKLLQNYSFAVASERLVQRVRLMTFQAMLCQDIGWFDLAENVSGALVARLATDAATVQAVTSETLNRWFVNMTTLVLVVAICFYYSWQMTLILLAMAPVMIASSYLTSIAMSSGSASSKNENDADSAAGSLLTNAIDAIRTVASFSMEKELTTQYTNFVDASKKTDVKLGLVNGAGFGFSLGIIFLVASLLFYVSGMWVDNGTITFEDMFVVLMVFSLSAFSVGMAAEGATDETKAKQAAQRIFKILDRTPKIDAMSTTGKVLPHVQGDLAFQNVQFAFPARPDAPIYQDLNLKIPGGQTVALVGASGSGKSTAIPLLERFYDPLGGKVTLDGENLRELSLTWLRDRISLVGQEPVLFAGTIAENIGLGKPDATREEVMEAAKEANAFDFISQLPDGFNTDVGDRGAQVSGGQKQRIAIARAILRDPEVLLLDEATSALDNESERLVQASLDKLLSLKKRTTIIVAHRLSSIRNADLIAVMESGAVVEQGTHDQLMRIPDGKYRRLLASQLGAQ